MCECERNSRTAIVFQRKFRMNLIVQRIMTAAAALSASALIAACAAHSTNPSNETFTVYEDAPKMSLLDLGQPGNSPGDVYHFSAPLRSSAGGQITGEVFGSKTLIKLATDADPDVEKRGTLLFFTFGAGQDQIVVFGITNYSPPASPLSVRFWAEPAITWVRVARSSARAMR